MIGDMMEAMDTGEAVTSASSVDKQNLLNELEYFVESWAGGISYIQYDLMCEELKKLVDKYL